MDTKPSVTELATTKGGRVALARESDEEPEEEPDFFGQSYRCTYMMQFTGGDRYFPTKSGYGPRPPVHRKKD